MRKRERAEGDLTLVCWALALPWPCKRSGPFQVALAHDHPRDA